MALVSMTGFGRGAAAAGGMKVEVDLSSVNRKQFDVRVSLPRSLIALEAPVNALVHARVARGAVTGVAKVTVTGAARRRGMVVDGDAAATYLRGLRRAARRMGLTDDLQASALLTMPEVLRYRDVGEDAGRVWRLLARALKAALNTLARMRQREGASLQKDIAARLGRLRRILEEIKGVAPDVARRYATALAERLKKARLGAEFDDAQLAREIALFADRCDISEEIVRLDSHFRQADHLLCARKPVGRTLDFLCQEMFREINTIGSKANDGGIARRVVEFKTDLEAVREQVQNVE